MRIFAIIIFLVGLLPASLCADNLKWLSTTYDFGSIREEAGKAHGSVQFVNLGTEPTVIQQVKSTCGCTGVGYTEGIIAPGDTATVWFDYNPTGRPGRFEKHIKVYTGLEKDLTSITIKGTVIGTPRSLESKYPYVNGNLRLTSDVIPFGKIIYGTSRHENIYGYNQSADTLKLSWREVPKYLTLAVSSKEILPGDLFTMSAYLNTRDGMEIGSINIPVALKATFADKTIETTLYITGKVEPDITSLTDEEMRNAPVASAFPTILDMGILTTPDRPVNIEFALRNEGKSQLNISRIHCADYPGLVKVKSMPKSLKPASMKTVKIEVNTDFLPVGDFKIPIEVVSNDPLHPAVRVYLIGTNTPN